MHVDCKYFGIRELIPPPEELPERLRLAFNADPDQLFRCFPWQFLVTLDRLRMLFGPAIVNNWTDFSDHTSAPFRYSGYRPMTCRIGAALSEHRFCRAGDLKFTRVAPAEVWAFMASNPDHEAFRFIERLEAYRGMTWVHFDLGQHARAGKSIRVFTVANNRAGLPEYIARAA